MADELSINILGAPTVTHASGAIVVARARVRALLWLLTAEDRPLDRERLGYLLWPEETTKVAQRNLSTHISYAKKALGAEALLVTGTTVALSDAVDTDLRRFNALAASEAADDALVALKLVSGSVLEGFIPVSYTHLGPRVLPLPHDGALAGDAAGAALQAAGIVERSGAVLVDLVEGGRAHPHEFLELLHIRVFRKLDMSVFLVDLVLVHGDELVDVHRDRRDLTHRAFSAPLMSRASLNRPCFFTMGMRRLERCRCV